MRVTFVPEGMVNWLWVVGEIPEALTRNVTEVGGSGDSVAVGSGVACACCALIAPVAQKILILATNRASSAETSSSTVLRECLDCKRFLGKGGSVIETVSFVVIASCVL